MTTTSVTLAAPVHGEWAVLNPPGHARLAFDLLATRGSRAPYRGTTFVRHLLASIGVEQVYGWGRSVVSPVDGVVAACSDGTPDRQRLNMPRDLLRLLLRPPAPGSPFSAYGGNHVIVDAGSGFVLLAHLRCGSVRVKPGQRVRIGDALGEVGNSGSSLQPHLHLQVMSSADPFPLFRNLLPFEVAGVAKRIDGRWTPPATVALANGDRLRFGSPTSCPGLRASPDPAP
jgi:Peptidase family M23